MSALPNQPVFEPLEPRRLLAVSVDANGWTQITPPSGARVVFVSSSQGNDANNGLSAASPVRSISRGKSLIRAGMGDQLLFRRGDTWDEPIGKWTAGGKDSQNPTVIGAYGPGERPLFRTGTKTGFAIYGYTGSPVHHVALIGLHFVAHTYNGFNGTFETQGIRLLRQGGNLLVEDVKVEGYKDNIVIDADGTGVDGCRIRRCVVVDAYAGPRVGNGHAQGLYAGPTTRNLLVEECVFDRNGWRPGVVQATQYSHNMYFQAGATGIVVRGNLVSRGAFRGTLLRSGGVVENNLYLLNPMAVHVAGNSSRISGNVIMSGVDHPEFLSGVGIDVATVASVQIESNLIAAGASAGKVNAHAINLDVGAKNVTVEGNTVWNWSRALTNLTSQPVTVRNNTWQRIDPGYPITDQRLEPSGSSATYRGNTYYSTRQRPNRVNWNDFTFTNWTAKVGETGARFGEVRYASPNRNVATYYLSLGGTRDARKFIDRVRKQSSQTWQNAYATWAVTRYIRKGFRVVSDASTARTVPDPGQDPPQSRFSSVPISDVPAFDPGRSIVEPIRSHLIPPGGAIQELIELLDAGVHLNDPIPGRGGSGEPVEVLELA